MIIFYLTFTLLLTFSIYYFIYLNNLNHNNLFIIIVNFILLNTIPLYLYIFKDNIYSLIISFFLLITANILNKEIKKIFHKQKIPSLIYLFITLYIFIYILFLNILLIHHF